MSMKTKNGSKGKKAKKSSTTLGNLPFWNAPKPGKINLKKKSVEVITLQRFNESPKIGRAHV